MSSDCVEKKRDIGVNPPCGVCSLANHQRVIVPKLANKLANKDHPNRPVACHKYLKQKLHMGAPSFNDVMFHLNVCLVGDQC